MSENKNTNEGKPKTLSLFEIERERSACREWLAANGGDKLTAETRETVEKSWLFRYEQQKIFNNRTTSAQDGSQNQRYNRLHSFT